MIKLLNGKSSVKMVKQVSELCSTIRSKALNGTKTDGIDELGRNIPIYLKDSSRNVGKIRSFNTYSQGNVQTVETYNKRGNLSSIVKIYSDGRYEVDYKPALKSKRSVLKSAKKMLERVLQSSAEKENVQTVNSYMPNTPEYRKMMERFGVTEGYYRSCMQTLEKFPALK